MSNCRLILTFIISLAVFNCYALESVDRLSVKILKAYEGNVLVLNRGIEDGVFKKDHTKIVSEEGFIARGICIRVSMNSSHWKIYRVTRPELVSMDKDYEMLSINQSQIPKDLSRFAKVDFSIYLETKYIDRKDRKLLALQQKRIINFDLPEQVNQTKTYEQKRKSGFTQFIDRALVDEAINRDFNNMQIDFFASPITWQTRNRQEEEHYGVKIHNIGLKYQYQINAIERRMEYRDPVAENTYRSKATYYDAQLQINRVTENMSLVSQISLNREKIGRIYYPHKNVRLGILGFRYHIWEEDPKDRFVDFTYLPIFDTMEYSTKDGEEIEELTGLRHKVQLRLFSFFSKNLHNKTIFTYEPFMNTEESFTVDENNNLSFMSTQFSWNLQNNFFMDYLVDYERDPFRGNTYNIASENTTQSIRFRYEWKL